MDGERGPVGPTGPTGPVGTGNMIWYDAKGERLERVAGTPAAPFYVDNEGIIWTFRPATGEFSWLILVESLFFEQADCGGEAYLAGAAVGPRLAFFVPGREQVYARFASQATSVAFCSLGSWERCVNVSPCDEATGVLPLSEMQEAVPPTLPHTPPFHPEWPE